MSQSRLEKIDAEIDRVWYSKWAAEEIEADSHQQRAVQWEKLPAKDIPLGQWAYDATRAVIGMSFGQSAANRKVWMFKTSNSVEMRPLDMPYWVRTGSKIVDCTCEVCVIVRERREFIRKRSL